MSEYPTWPALNEQNQRDMNKQLKRIADALESQNDVLRDLILTREAKSITTELKQEDQELHVDTKIYDSLEVTEEIIMDTNDVTVMNQTDKAILVHKQGYQKWIPKSLIEEPTEVVDGFFGHIIIRDKRGGEKTAPKDWFPKKPWDKYEVYKKR